MPKSKKRFLKSVALVVDQQVITSVAQHPLSSTGVVPDDHCVVQCQTSNMGKTKEQGDQWRGMLSRK